MSIVSGNQPAASSSNVSIEAVVISISKDCWILATETPDSEQETFFWMSQNSSNIIRQGVFPRMQEEVLIREVIEKPSVTSNSAVFKFVNKFEFTPRPDRGYEKQEVMAVTKVMKNYISLVGKSLETETYACIPDDTSCFSIGQLVIGDLVELPYFVEACKPDSTNDDVIHYKKNFEAEKVKKHPRALLYPENVRPLTPSEEWKVITRCAHETDIELREAQRFIQEPLIAAGLLEKNLQYQEVLRYTVTNETMSVVSGNQSAASSGNCLVSMEAVVISISKDCWILATETSNSDQETFFWMSQNSSNIIRQGLFPRMQEEVLILEVIEKPNVTSGSVASKFVAKFEFTPRPDRGYEKQEVMAVAKVMKNYISLVGKSLETETYACIPDDTSCFSIGQLVIGDLVELPYFVEVCKQDLVKDDVIHYKKNFEAEKGKKHPRALLYPENVRPLTPSEEWKVITRCAHETDIELHEAQRFIQEPLIAAGLLEKNLQYQEVLRYTVTTENVEIGIGNHGTPTLCFQVDIATYIHLFQTLSQATWRVGGELQIVHKLLGKADMVIRTVTNCNEAYKIELHSTIRSRDVLKAAFSHKSALEGEIFTISPIFYQDSAVINSLKVNFNKFFLKRRNMFDLCTGRADKPSEVEIKDRNEPFFVNGSPLDASQLDFMLSAATVPGFTCAQAPPGCGKTHTTSALISYLNKMKVTGGICISGTTNAAVTNAADAVASRFPEIRITREYSVKAEANISGASQKASLKCMAEEAEKYVNPDEHSKLMIDLAMMQFAKEQLNEDACNLDEQLSRIEKAVSLEKHMKNNFVKAYDLQVYATTVELLIRRGDIFRGRENGDEETLRRLILDEAAQMSPLEAMAIYCSLPHLEYITLLGDMKQLGPHCTLPEYSMCHKLLSEGELTRMYKLRSSTKKELNTIYRCHPTITQKLLVPIYGPQIKAGATASSRSLVQDKGLLSAQDGSPCVLIDVDGREEKGRNQEELKMALELISDIVDKKGVPAEDVVVICNHKAQMNSLIQELKGQGEFRALKTKVAVHTVDSFQGKEAKVVIVLTTKTCAHRDNGKLKMKFVGDAARGTVAVSRAQHALYVLGHWNSLAKTQFWSQFLRNNTVIPGEIVKRQLTGQNQGNHMTYFNDQLLQTTARLSDFRLSPRHSPRAARLCDFISYRQLTACPPIRFNSFY